MSAYTCLHIYSSQTYYYNKQFLQQAFFTFVQGTHTVVDSTGVTSDGGP